MVLDFLDCCANLTELWWTRHGGVATDGLAAHRLRSLVAHARRASPFYRAHYAHVPASATLERLPPVTKRSLMARFDDWATDREVTLAGVNRFFATRALDEPYLGRYYAWKSSGTTGEPGIFVQDGHAMAVYDALAAMQLQSLPWSPDRLARTAAFRGRAALVAATEDHFAGVTAWEHVRRAYPVPEARVFPVTAPTRELVAALNEFRPALLAGYPSAVAILAGERRAGRLAIDPAAIWCSGEVLPRSMREAISQAFGCPVVNEYGASEALAIAHECAHGVLHVDSDWVLVEAIDARGEHAPPGETSHTTLVTNLANWLQPVIRYDLGDRVTFLDRPCECGSALPALRVDGRRDEIVTLDAPDGARVRLTPMALTTVVEEGAKLHRFQLVQDAPDHLALRIDPCEGSRSVAWKRAEPVLLSYLRRQGLGNVRVSLAHEAPRADARSGKLRGVVVERAPG
jgi:phenylacetate-coenzyme A ligase PaaK-like adenylate-forming protein